MFDTFNKADIVKLVGGISHEKLQAYLMQTGWEQSSNVREIASVWHRPVDDDKDDIEVVVPSTRSLSDYAFRIFDAVKVLSTFEKKSIQDIVKGISGFFADAISIRVIHPDVSDGTIPIDDGLALNQHAKELLTYAALSTHSKRRSFSGAKPSETIAYIDSLRLGQTAVGSYIVNVLAPIPAVTSQESIMPSSSLSRVVTDTLISSLNALIKASQNFSKTNDLRVFDSTIENGVSSNLCDALVGFSGENLKREFEIIVSPSHADKSKPESCKFVFSRTQIAHIAKASEHFKENYVLENITIEGFVKRLDRPKSHEIGTVVIETKIHDVDKNVSVELTSNDYILAVTAHKAESLVSCKGDLHVTPRTAKLLNPRQFKALGITDLFE